MPKPKGAKTRKADPRKTGPQGWSLTEREGIKAEIQKLDRRGFNQNQIVEAIGRGRISQATVSNMLKEIQEDYAKAYVDDRKAKAERARAALEEVIAECWTQIERLKAEGKKKRGTKTGSNDSGGWSEESELVEDADIGGYLMLISKNVVEVAALYGLKALPEQVFNVINVNAGDSENLFERMMRLMDPGPRVVAPAVEDKPKPPEANDSIGNAGVE